MRSPWTGVRALATAALLGALVACGGPQQPSSSARPSGTIDASSARRLIEGARLDDRGSLQALNAVRFTGPGAQAARDALAAGGSTDALWAAIWVYASAASDPAPLKPLLQNADPSLRVMAAAAVVASGDRDGFPVIAVSLGDDGGLLGSDPPQSISGFAASTLFRFVSGSGVPIETDEAAQLAGIAQQWRTWLEGHVASLVYERGTWSVR